VSVKAKRERRKERKRERGAALTKSRRFGYLKYVAIAVVVVGGVAGFLAYSLATAKILPPTSFTAAHSELLPTMQINTRPIDRLIQEHVMERNVTHPDGRMLVQYNCEDYECEGGISGFTGAETAQRSTARCNAPIQSREWTNKPTRACLPTPADLSWATADQMLESSWPNVTSSLPGETRAILSRFPRAAWSQTVGTVSGCSVSGTGSRVMADFSIVDGVEVDRFV